MRLGWGQVAMVKSKQIPEKCRRCALLGAAEARSTHPSCWDDRLCHSRRSYARNRDKINQKRARVRIEQVHQVDVPQVTYGVLQVWRERQFGVFGINPRKGGFWKMRVGTIILKSLLVNVFS